MAECAYCKADTELYVGGVPICLKCSEEREAKRKPPIERDVRTSLIQGIAEATERANEASEAFGKVIDQAPSGLPHPDGVQRIHNA